MRIDQLVGRRWRLDQDAEPAERIAAGELVAVARGDRRPRDAVEAVAAGDEVAFEFVDFSVPVKPRLRRRGVQVVTRDVLYAEQQRAAGGQARGDQVLDHLVLRVDGDGAAGELGERDAVAASGEAQIDAFV